MVLKQKCAPVYTRNLIKAESTSKGFLTSTSNGIIGMDKLEGAKQPANSIQCKSYQRSLLILKEKSTLSFAPPLLLRFMSYN